VCSSDLGERGLALRPTHDEPTHQTNATTHASSTDGDTQTKRRNTTDETTYLYLM
jgi:hypothetical protein